MGLPAIAAAVALLFFGKHAMENTEFSLRQASILRDRSNGDPAGYDEPSNQVVDPSIFTYRPFHPLSRDEPGPFGVGRQVYNVGGQFETPLTSTNYTKF